MEAVQAPVGTDGGGDGGGDMENEGCTQRKMGLYNKDREQPWGFGFTPGWKLTDECGQSTERMSISREILLIVVYLYCNVFLSKNVNARS